MDLNSYITLGLAALVGLTHLHVTGKLGKALTKIDAIGKQVTNDVPAVAPLVEAGLTVAGKGDLAAKVAQATDKTVQAAGVVTSAVETVQNAAAAPQAKS